MIRSQREGGKSRRQHLNKNTLIKSRKGSYFYTPFSHCNQVAIPIFLNSYREGIFHLKLHFFISKIGITKNNFVRFNGYKQKDEETKKLSDEIKRGGNFLKQFFHASTHAKTH